MAREPRRRRVKRPHKYRWRTLDAFLAARHPETAAARHPETAAARHPENTN